MDLDELLRRGGTDLPSVVAHVGEAVGLGRGDVLLAVGSVVEGIGTSRSDVDLILVTPRAQGRLPPQESVTLVVNRCLIDMRVLRWAAADELLARFEAWSRLAWSVTYAVKFSLDERTLLHRLLNGLVVARGEGERLTSRVPKRADLARLKLHVARQFARTIQVDMVGYRDGGDHRSLVFAAQELLGHAVDALVAGHGMTNPLIKWRSRMLDFVPRDWEAGLAARPTGLTAGERVWRLHRAPARPGEGPALEHAFRISAFARAVFLWAERQLVEGAAPRSLGRAGSPATRRNEPVLPRLDFDVDFARADGRASLARLNAFGEPLALSERELAISLLFDGVTTAGEAQRVVFGRRGGTGAGAVNRLMSRLARAGLLFQFRRASL